jgi:hypothetical protein
MGRLWMAMLMRFLQFMACLIFPREQEMTLK